MSSDVSVARIRATFAGLVLAMLLAALDQNIVAVALPRIGADLDGFATLTWVVSAYLIASAVATPLFGKLGDLAGRRTALSAAIAVFVLGATACALAPSMAALIAGRVLQGVGAGAIVAVAQAAIADIVSPRERGRYQVYFSAMHVVASVAGPVLGGLLTAYLSWRWNFWINIPLGLLALVVARRTLAHIPLPQRQGRAHVDVLGALLLTGGLVALLVGVTRTGMGAALATPLQAGLFAGAALLLAAFGWWERRVREPLVPPSLFAIPTLRLSCLVLFVAYMQLVALTVLVPLRAQTVEALAADQAALRLLPLTLAGPFGAWLAGRIMQRTAQARVLQIAGAALVGAALAGLGWAGGWLQPAWLALAGLGIGLQLPTSLVAVQNAVPPAQIGVATAAAAFARSLGAAIGLAVLGAVLVSLLGNNGIGAARAFDRVFLVSAAIAAASFAASWFLPRERLRD